MGVCKPNNSIVCLQVLPHQCFNFIQPDRYFLQLFARFFSLSVGVLLIVLATLGVQLEEIHAQSTSNSATYIVKFTDNGNVQSTSNFSEVHYSHFSPLVGAIHNNDAIIWKVGEMAILGVEDIAGTDDLEKLSEKIQDLIDTGKVKSFIMKNQEVVNASGTIEFEIKVSKTHPLITLLAMITSSPNWFIGVSNLSLLDDNNAWQKKIKRDLFAYYASTKEGERILTISSDTFSQTNLTSLKYNEDHDNFSDTIAIATLEFNLKPTPATVIVGNNGDKALATRDRDDDDDYRDRDDDDDYRDRDDDDDYRDRDDDDDYRDRDDDDDGDGCALVSEKSGKSNFFNLLLAVFGVLLMVLLSTHKFIYKLLFLSKLWRYNCSFSQTTQKWK